MDFVTKEYPPHIYGGAGVHVSELVSALRKQIDTRVHCFGDPITELGTLGYPIPKGYENSNPALQTLAVDLSMVEAIRGANLVHSHTWYANNAGHTASLLHEIPHIITAHSLEPMRPWKKEQLGGGYALSLHIEKSAYQQAAKIIAVSQGMRVDILASYPEIDPDKVEVVYNGIDSEKWQPVENLDDLLEALQEHGINPNKRSVIFVGRITRQKGLTYFLEAARQLPDDVQLILCAGAPDTDQLMNEVSQLVSKLSKERSGVIWIPEHLPQPKLAALLTNADLFVCPSIYEPLGIVNLEAMACQVPVLATATGGIPEVVIHGETGWLVPIEQFQDGSGTPIDEAKFVFDWGKALNHALASQDLVRFGKAGRSRAIKEFSWETVATRTLEVYRRALEG